MSVSRPVPWCKKKKRKEKRKKENRALYVLTQSTFTHKKKLLTSTLILLSLRHHAEISNTADRDSKPCCLSQQNEANINAVSALLNLLTELSLHTVLHATCCTRKAPDYYVAGICTRLCAGRLSVRVGDRGAVRRL